MAKGVSLQIKSQAQIDAVRLFIQAELMVQKSDHLMLVRNTLMVIG